MLFELIITAHVIIEKKYNTSVSVIKSCQRGAWRDVSAREMTVARFLVRCIASQSGYHFNSFWFFYFKCLYSLKENIWL